MIRTEVGGVSRYRSDGNITNYWTIYEQREDSWFFSGSVIPTHTIGLEFRGSPGTYKGRSWEALV